MPRLTKVGLACLVLAVVAGCGSDKNDSSSTPAAAKPAPAESTTAPTATATDDSASSTGAVVKVSMKDIKFVPEKIAVKVGQKIQWTNDDAVAHNVTATDGADFASDTINGGGTYSYTPTKAGVIQYVCTIHSGQNGEIRVTK
jgi:plastocyanin